MTQTHKRSQIAAKPTAGVEIVPTPVGMCLHASNKTWKQPETQYAENENPPSLASGLFVFKCAQECKNHYCADAPTRVTLRVLAMTL